MLVSKYPDLPPPTRAESLNALARQLAGMSKLTATDIGLLTFAVYDTLDEYVEVSGKAGQARHRLPATCAGYWTPKDATPKEC